jgi:hypothetical protein
MESCHEFNSPPMISPLISSRLTSPSFTRFVGECGLSFELPQVNSATTFLPFGSLNGPP